MNGTKIEWVKNPDGTQGYTSNPVRGECPIGCAYCYVKSLRNRFSWHRDIRFYPQELGAIQRHKKPCGIFLGSTIELFHDKTIGYMPEIIETIRACPQHRFYLLTKQAAQLPQFSPFPENAWVGVTCTNQTMVLEATNHLYNHRIAKTQFLSIEPLLSWDTSHFSHPLTDSISKLDIDWLIIGQQTPVSAKTQPRIEWIQEIVEAADKAGIPVFLKDNLESLWTLENRREPFFKFSRVSPGATEIGKLRQEMPKGQNPLDIISTSVLQYCHKLTEGGRHENSGGGC